MEGREEKVERAWPWVWAWAWEAGVVVTKAVVGGEDTALALAPRDTEKAPSSQEKAKVEKVGKVIQLDEKYSSGSWTSAPPLVGGQDM